jgi:hypothetical protein
MKEKSRTISIMVGAAAAINGLLLFDSGMLSSQIVEHSHFEVYERAPHGMCPPTQHISI